MQWIGDPPTHCDLCNTPITDEFVDGKTIYGPWACMCLECHAAQGQGLDTGRGQHYKKDGEIFIKV